ncbi:hypothetical protein P691DRAFT_598841 [Macrolepiota fuliginosa MF-IS2]|uniref:Uncharacterized protein n=1 Tax=Macrolepiota fuliginosa MF-IS2 TaxID=1400762 RepID=A0A9P6C530_9AGAR|nr:hypothetical protein P691DRAFT_598841 [Macrolepiota fuliginosa MF-IS2]
MSLPFVVIVSVGANPCHLPVNPALQNNPIPPPSCVPRTSLRQHIRACYCHSLASHGPPYFVASTCAIHWN